MTVQQNKAITVAHVITRLDPGGSATNTIISADRLREYGFDSKLIYGPTKDDNNFVKKTLESRGINSVLLPSLAREIHPVKDIIALTALIRLFKQNQFDLIHTHTSKAGLIGRIAAWILGMPCVHTPHGHVFYGYFGKGKTSVFVALEKFAAKLSKRIISLTDEETRESLERRIGKPEQYVTIPSGINLAEFLEIEKQNDGPFRRRYNIPGNATVILSVGRLTQIKGFDILLQGFANADFGAIPCYLVITGDGEERDNLEKLTAKLGVTGHTIFTGWLDNTREALAASDVFALASRNEGMGRAFIEAMASGLPVIGPRTGGVPTLIKNGQTGILVEKNDIKGLASAMTLLANDASLRAVKGRQAREFVRSSFDEKHMIDALSRVYGEILSQRNATTRKKEGNCFAVRRNQR